MPPGRPDVLDDVVEPLPEAAENETTDPPVAIVIELPVDPPAGEASCSASKSIIART